MVWNLHKFGTSHGYGTTINLFFFKLCRKNPTRNVVDWYEMGVMVYFFEFWWSWFWFGRKFSVKGAKFGQLCVLLDTPMPRRRSARLSVELFLSGGLYA